MFVFAEHPEMLRDQVRKKPDKIVKKLYRKYFQLKFILLQYWDEIIPEDIPYTQATEKFKISNPFVRSSLTDFPMEKMEFISLTDKVK